MALFVKRDHKDSWLNVETLFPSYCIWLTHVRHFLFRSADCTAAPPQQPTTLAFGNTLLCVRPSSNTTSDKSRIAYDSFLLERTL